MWAGEEYGELFDLERDPDEFENRFFDPEYAGVRADLYRQLCHRMMEDEDPLPERRTFW